MRGVTAASLRELLSDIFPGQASALFHLLHCSACRSWASESLLREQGIYLLLPPFWPEEPLPPMPKPMVEPADSAMALLISHPPERRFELLADDRFRTGDLLDLLLETSQTLQLDDPDLAEHLGLLAGRLSGLLSGNHTAALTRAGILVANARRLAGRLGP